MSATLADIARATNTSVSTVSRVLSNAPAASRISAETRRRITTTADKLGYRPNLLARSLRTRKSHTIAVIVSDIANPWFGQLAGHIEQSLHRHGYSLVVCNSGEDQDLEDEYLQLLPQKSIDGLIIVPITTERDHLYQFIPESLPLVIVDRPIEGIAASITSDQHAASHLLCDQLQQIGARNIALIRGPGHVYTHRIRAAVARERFNVILDHEGPAQHATAHAAADQIARAKPDAILCTNNFLGQGILESLPPKTPPGSPPIPLACFDEIPLMHLLPTPITCCVQNVPNLAEGAVEMLLTQLKNHPPTPKTIPAQTLSNPPFTQLQHS